MRCVDCVCATEPPCSSGCGVTDAGAAAIARALEKNSTLRELYLSSEIVVLRRVSGGGLILVYVVLGCCWFVFGVEGRVRCVDCVCATEPPWCSSESDFGDAGAAWLAQALEKNTTLQTLDLNGEFVVLCCVCGGGLIVVYVVVGCCWFVFLG